MKLKMVSEEEDSITSRKEKDENLQLDSLQYTGRKIDLLGRCVFLPILPDEVDKTYQVSSTIPIRGTYGFNKTYIYTFLPGFTIDIRFSFEIVIIALIEPQVE